MTDTEAPAGRPDSESGARVAFNRFVQRHNIAWELAMAGLAIVYVLLGLAPDFAPGWNAPLVGTLETALTGLFIAEFATRFLASFNRLAYLRHHILDLVALLPVARGLRIARVLRLLRLVRTFTGLRRVFTNVDRLANHHALGTLVIAWFGTMFLCSSAFYAVEAGVNPQLDDLGDAVWWGIATLTGGATDVQAVTYEGRLATAALLIVGVALFTAITAALVSFMVSGSRPRTATDSDPFADLERLADLRRREAITATEFEAKRTELLSRI